MMSFSSFQNKNYFIKTYTCFLFCMFFKWWGLLVFSNPAAWAGHRQPYLLGKRAESKWSSYLRGMSRRARRTPSESIIVLISNLNLTQTGSQKLPHFGFDLRRADNFFCSFVCGMIAKGSPKIQINFKAPQKNNDAYFISRFNI